MNSSRCSQRLGASGSGGFLTLPPFSIISSPSCEQAGVAPASQGKRAGGESRLPPTRLRTRLP